MSIILGLDVSTSCTGVCIVDSDIPPDDNGSHILKLDRIEFKGCKTVWEKADVVAGVMIKEKCAIDRVVLEEALLGFRPGMSSAMTISTLMRFNGIVSYIARNTFGVEPEYIGSAHARKLCGVKLQRTAIAGPQKAQVFKHMAEHDLQHVKWPVKKSGKVVEWAGDATDAYVIAKAAMINGPIIVVKKTQEVQEDG